MAKRLGSLLLLKDYRENANLSCLKELGDGEVTGLPVVVGQMEGYREKSNLSCLKELDNGEDSGPHVVAEGL
jgi:hypothetical protein